MPPIYCVFLCVLVVMDAELYEKATLKRKERSAQATEPSKKKKKEVAAKKPRKPTQAEIQADYNERNERERVERFEKARVEQEKVRRKELRDIFAKIEDYEALKNVQGKELIGAPWSNSMDLLRWGPTANSMDSLRWQTTALNQVGLKKASSDVFPYFVDPEAGPKLAKYLEEIATIERRKWESPAPDGKKTLDPLWAEAQEAMSKGHYCTCGAVGLLPHPST